MAVQKKPLGKDVTPASLIGQSIRQLVGVATKRLATTMSDKVGQLTTYAANSGKIGDVVAEALTKGDEGGPNGDGDRFKVTSIIEQIDVGAPIDLVYDQWTRFTDFPAMMKKVENVEQLSDEKLRWTVRVLWSRRTWESTILDQVPNERIVWTSEGDKGSVDGAVTFHELAPDLTRVVLVLEYHPRGLFERTGNLWRAQGRRARLELKNFQRHVMTEAVLHADEIEGWRGEIHDGEVRDEDEGGDEAEDEGADEAEAEAAPDEGPDEKEDEPERERPRSRTGRGESSTRNRTTRERRNRT